MASNTATVQLYARSSKKVYDKLKQIEVDHKSFDDHVLQMMDKVATDNLDGLIKLEKQIHAEEKALDHAVESTHVLDSALHTWNARRRMVDLVPAGQTGLRITADR